MSLAHLLISKEAPLASDLDELVRRSRAGDLDAFDALVERFRGVTFGLAYRILRDYETATDATQEIFIKAWRNLHRFRGAAKFTTWLHSIAVNHCLDVARRQARQNEYFQTALPEDKPDATEGLERWDNVPALAHDWDLHLALREALRKLPEKLRVVVTLYYYADCTLKEIGEMLNLPQGTVYSRLRAALSSLEREMGGAER
jgi:RNA polymerase sigma-70 factor (ECF subfamily)